MPYTVGCSPAPLTFTIHPKLDWQTLASVAWLCFVGYALYTVNWHKITPDFGETALLVLMFFGVLVSFIRRERIEIYPDRMVWKKTYFGITRSKSAPLADILAVEWNKGDERGERQKGPDYIEFYLSTGSVKACFGFTFDEFEKMRQDIAGMFPDLVKRWGTSTVRSKTFTLLNLT